MFGFGLACLIVILGVLVATDRLVRHAANPGTETVEEVRAFYAIPLADMRFIFFWKMQMLPSSPTREYPSLQ